VVLGRLYFDDYQQDVQSDARRAIWFG
jgi:hypothetical protein